MDKIKQGKCKGCVYWGICGTQKRKEECSVRVTFDELKAKAEGSKNRTGVRK